MKLIPACYCSDDHDKGEESWNINNIYVYVCVYICVCVCVLPILLVIIMSRAIARSSSFTPSLGLSFMTSLPNDEATIDPLKFIPSSSRSNRMKRSSK